MLRRSFLKACSAVSAMSVLGGVKALSSEGASKTFVDLYAEWAMSRQANVVHRLCEVNNMPISKASSMLIRRARRKASMGDHGDNRVLIVIKEESVEFVGRNRSEWVRGTFIADHVYRDSISAVRDYFVQLVDPAIQFKTIVLPGYGDQCVVVQKQTPLIAKAAIVGLYSDHAMILMSDDVEHDIAEICRTDAWQDISAAAVV